jgi:hypothetical protein
MLAEAYFVGTMLLGDKQALGLWQLIWAVVWVQCTVFWVDSVTKACME